MKDRISQLLDESGSHARARVDESPRTPMPAALTKAVQRRRRNIIMTRFSVAAAALLCAGVALFLSLPSSNGTTTGKLNTPKAISNAQSSQAAPETIASQHQSERSLSSSAQVNPTLSRLSKTMHREGIESAMELLPVAASQGDGSKIYSPRSNITDLTE